MEKKRNIWTMTELRRGFYDIVRAATKEPQVITVRGKVKYYIVPIFDPVVQKYEAERAAKVGRSKTRGR